MKPGLYLVATPIGNLADITIRALDTLGAADFVVCEDKRVAANLLNYYGLKKELFLYNDHSDGAQREKIIDRILSGETAALISDAGTPLVSDPGYKLVQSCREKDIYVTVIPGPSAVLSALQLSGLPSDSFSFAGFLPAKTKARQGRLEELKNHPGTMIVFETAPRLIGALEDIAAILGQRTMAVVREITKIYEETRRGTPQELLSFYSKNGPPKGEIVLVIEGQTEVEYSEKDIEKMLQNAVKNMATKEAAAHVAEITGRPRKMLYDMALRISKT